MAINNPKDFLKRISDSNSITAIAIAIVAVIYFIYTLLGQGNTSVAILITLAFIGLTSLYILCLDIKLEDYFKKNKDVLEKIENEFKGLKQTNDIAKVRKIQNQEEFYKLLGIKIREAKDRVLLLDFATLPPNLYTDGRANFHNFIVNFASENKNIKIRRISSLPTSQKLEWMKNLLIITQDIHNLSLAYIKLIKLENVFPQPVINCKIIDNDKIFLLNPSANIIPGGAFQPILYIENPIIVEIYTQYYEKLWDKVNTNIDFGYLLKDGPHTYQQNLKAIQDYINESESDTRLY